jgi:hypothetical protein
LSADHQAIYQMGTDLVTTAGSLDQAHQNVDGRGGDGEGVFGEYGAAEQFPGFRQAWLDEISVYHDALGQTGQAIMNAAQRYHATDRWYSRRYGG